MCIAAVSPIIHSDIKPKNIMVTPYRNVCFVDFNASLGVRDSLLLKYGNGILLYWRMDMEGPQELR